MSPCLSVITPLYNAEAYVRESIESILAQSLRDFEYIIIDDGSSDASLAIACAYARQDARVRVYTQENKGQVQARNIGLHAASAPVIAFQDADDIAVYTRLEEQYAFLQAHPRCGAVGCFLAPFDTQGTVYRELQYPTDPAALAAESYAGNCVIAGCALMARAECLESFDAAFRPAEDYALLLRILQTHELGIVPRVLLHYRQHGHNLSNTQALSQRWAAQAARYCFLYHQGSFTGNAATFEGLCRAAAGHESAFWTELSLEVLASHRIPAVAKVQHLELALQALPPYHFEARARRKLLSAILRLPLAVRQKAPLLLRCIFA